jgi:hypothetical protein
MAKFTSKQVDGAWCVLQGDLVVSKCGGRTEARDRAKAMNTEAPKATPSEAPAAPQVDETVAAMTDGELYNLASKEHKAQREAKKAGKPIPAAPHLDEMHRRSASGIKVGGKSKSSTPRAPKIDVQYFKDGRAIPASQNKLSSMAYYFSRGLDGDKPRIGTAEFVAVIAKATKLEPSKVTTSSFDCKLPNGIVIAARVKGDDTPVAVPEKAERAPRKAAAAKKSTAAKKAPAKKATPAKRAAKQVTPIPKKSTRSTSKRQTRKAS